jgi:hypothetical protein
VKRLSLLLVIIVFGTMSATLHAVDGAPTLNIEAAMKIAQDYLKGAAPSDQRFLAALSLERPAITGVHYWYARWSSPILGGGKPEVGLRIDMDGSLTKVLSDEGVGSGTTWGGSGPSVPVPGVGSQKFGARNLH